MAGEQFDLDFRLVQLPKPVVIRCVVRPSDIPIGDDPLVVPGQLEHGVAILEAMKELSGHPLNEEIYPSRSIGYRTIAGAIRKKYGRIIASSSIGFTIHELIRLGFLKRLADAGFTAAYEHQVLTIPGMKVMLKRVGATHFRTCRREVHLIGPVNPGIAI